MTNICVVATQTNECEVAELSEKLTELGHETSSFKHDRDINDTIYDIMSSDVFIAIMPCDDFVSLTIGVAIASGSKMIVIADSVASHKQYSKISNIVCVLSITDCVEIVNKLSKSLLEIK